MPGAARLSSHVLAANLIERFDAVLYPIPVQVLLQVMPQWGWVVPQMEATQGEIKLSGPVTKGSTQLALDPDKKLLGVRGSSPSECIEAFRELREQVSHWVAGIPTDYVEVRYTAEVETGPGLRAGLARHWAKVVPEQPQGGIIDTISRAFGIPPDLAPYGFRVATASHGPNSPEWSELTVAPVASNADSLARVDFIFRSANSQSAVSAMKHAEDGVIQLVRKLLA